MYSFAYEILEGDDIIDSHVLAPISGQHGTLLKKT
jgi:hypothetical protein